MLIGHLRMRSFSSMLEHKKRAQAFVAGVLSGILVAFVGGVAQAQEAAMSVAAPSGEVEGGLERDPGLARPVFGAVQLGAELGTNYNAGVGLGVFGTLVPGVSLGGFAYVAPLTYVAAQCRTTCSTPAIVLTRAMAELRLGTPYAEYRKGLGWFGVDLGVAYESGLGLDPSPLAAIAVGGDVRINRSLWFEFAPRFTWTQFVGGGAYAYANFMAGLNLGLRVDFKR
jgi:hypothetical protein